jgi:TolB protein
VKVRASEVLKRVVLVFCILSAVQAGAQTAEHGPYKIWQVPNLGQAAEFYFSPDGKSLIGNAKQPGDTTFHVYTIQVDGARLTKINDRGDDACSFFFPDGKHIVYTSTRDLAQLPRGNFSDPGNYPQGAELYVADSDGSHPRRLTSNTQYDAEVSVSPDGKWILFTRQVDGQLDLWKVHPDGSGETQITFTKGIQEGGSFYVGDHTIIFRAWDIGDQGQHGIPMAVSTIHDDGSGRTLVSRESGTNWAPYPAPDGDHYAFVKIVPPRNFEIFVGSISTGTLTQLTFNDAFDGFPSISPDGNLLTFSSLRDSKEGEHIIRQYLMDISSLGLGKPKSARDKTDASVH